MKNLKILSENSEENFVLNSFYKDGKPVQGAFWGMTLKAAGSMRFRWNETNPLRDSQLKEIAGNREIVPVQLDHTKIVYKADSFSDTEGKIGDGIISLNPDIFPVVTVADCMPLYFFDPVSGFFGVVHSGWKGTGIAGEAVSLAEREFGAQRKNICVAIGPHINDCCYVVNRERAEYFSGNFTPECVTPIGDGEVLCRGAASSWDSGSGPLFRLSLLKANLAVLERSGIREENIVTAEECTCCNGRLGSNRRETSLGSTFTVQAAFTLRTL